MCALDRESAGSLRDRKSRPLPCVEKAIGDWMRGDGRARRSVVSARKEPRYETAQQRIARLEREIAVLRKENESLRKEKESLRADCEILRQAAAVFVKDDE
jgi:chromosome segregation ATPase